MKGSWRYLFRQLLLGERKLNNVAKNWTNSSPNVNSVRTVFSKQGVINAYDTRDHQFEVLVRSLEVKLIKVDISHQIFAEFC